MPLSASALAPGDLVVGAIELTNGGGIDLRYSLRLEADLDQVLRDAVTLRALVVGGTAACPTQAAWRAGDVRPTVEISGAAWAADPLTVFGDAAAGTGPRRPAPARRRERTGVPGAGCCARHTGGRGGPRVASWCSSPWPSRSSIPTREEVSDDGERSAPAPGGRTRSDHRAAGRDGGDSGDRRGRCGDGLSPDRHPQRQHGRGRTTRVADHRQARTDGGGRRHPRHARLRSADGHPPRGGSRAGRRRWSPRGDAGRRQPGRRPGRLPAGRTRARRHAGDRRRRQLVPHHPATDDRARRHGDAAARFRRDGAASHLGPTPGGAAGWRGHR